MRCGNMAINDFSSYKMGKKLKKGYLGLGWGPNLMRESLIQGMTFSVGIIIRTSISKNGMFRLEIILILFFDILSRLNYVFVPSSNGKREVRAFCNSFQVNPKFEECQDVQGVSEKWALGCTGCIREMGKLILVCCFSFGHEPHFGPHISVSQQRSHNKQVANFSKVELISLIHSV